MFRRVFLATCILMSVAAAAAQEFYIKGELTPPDGVPLGITSFVLRTIDSHSFENVKITGNIYTHNPKLTTYADKTIIFDFPFPSESMLFSMESLELRIPQETNGGANFTKDFTFFRPAEYAGIVAEKVAKIRSVENCDEFSTLGHRLAELSAVPAEQLKGARSNVLVLSRSGATLAVKLLHHNCSLDRLDVVTSALNGFMSTEEFKQLPPAGKIALAEDISHVAIQVKDDDLDTRQAVLGGLMPLLERAIPEFQPPAIVEIRVANLYYAKAQFLRLSDNFLTSKQFIQTVIEQGAIKAHRAVEGSLLYDYFLIVSGATRISDEPGYHYDLPLPSNDGFESEASAEDKADWCWLSKQYFSRPNLERQWTREKVRTAMRLEMAATRKLNSCKEGT